MIKGVDYTGITGSCICLDDDGRFILSKRSQNCRDEQGTWEIVGGSIEFGETLEEHVRREVREEYNAQLGELKLLEPVTLNRVHNGKATHWILFVWTAKVLNIPDVRINDPRAIDEIGWFTLDTLPSPLHSATLLELELAKKHGII